MRTCSKCKGENDSIKSSWCKQCHRDHAKGWYRSRTEKHKKIVLKSRKDLQDRNRSFLLSFLRDNTCVDCGEDDPIVLEFDHLRDKSCNISSMLGGYSIERIQEEINKCDVVCRNCHARRTCSRVGWYKLALAGGSGQRTSNPLG